MGGKEHRAPKIDQRSNIQDMERQPGKNRRREKHGDRLEDGERIGSPILYVAEKICKIFDKISAVDRIFDLLIIINLIILITIGVII